MSIYVKLLKAYMIIYAICHLAYMHIYAIIMTVKGEQTKTVQTPAEDGRRTSTRVGKEQQSAARLTRSVESPQPPEFPRAKKKRPARRRKHKQDATTKGVVFSITRPAEKGKGFHL